MAQPSCQGVALTSHTSPRISVKTASSKRSEGTLKFEEIQRSDPDIDRSSEGYQISDETVKRDLILFIYDIVSAEKGALDGGGSGSGQTRVVAADSNRLGPPDRV